MYHISSLSRSQVNRGQDATTDVLVLIAATSNTPKTQPVQVLQARQLAYFNVKTHHVFHIFFGGILLQLSPLLSWQSCRTRVHYFINCALQSLKVHVAAVINFIQRLLTVVPLTFYDISTDLCVLDTRLSACINNLLDDVVRLIRGRRVAVESKT